MSLDTPRPEYSVPPDFASDLQDRLGSYLPEGRVESLRAIIDELEEPYRSVVELTFWGRWTASEIGDHFGRNRHWVARQKRKAYKQLRGRLDGELLAGGEAEDGGGGG